MDTVGYSDHGLNNGLFDNQTHVHYLNSKIVLYSDPHWIRYSDPVHSKDTYLVLESASSVSCDHCYPDQLFRVIISTDHRHGVNGVVHAGLARFRIHEAREFDRVVDNIWRRIESLATVFGNGHNSPAVDAILRQRFAKWRLKFSEIEPIKQELATGFKNVVPNCWS